MLKALARLTAVSDAAWAMAARAIEKGNNNNDKLEVDALRLAKDTAIDIADIVTNNQSFVDVAFEAATAYDQDDEEEQQQRQMNKNLKASQQEDKKNEEEPIF